MSEAVTAARAGFVRCKHLWSVKGLDSVVTIKGKVRCVYCGKTGPMPKPNAIKKA